MNSPYFPIKLLTHYLTPTIGESQGILDASDINVFGLLQNKGIKRSSRRV